VASSIPGEAVVLDDPVPINYGNTGCPATVRRGAGQWTSCGSQPVVAGNVNGRGRERHRVFPCARHSELVQDVQPLTDEDRAEVERRREECAT
jgi:hypothetical protein